MRIFGRSLLRVAESVADSLGVHMAVIVFVFIAAILWGDYFFFGRHGGQSRISHVKTPREAGIYTLFLGSIILVVYLLDR